MKFTENPADAAALAELGSRLAHRRVEKGMTQAELAREAGVSKRTVERLEAGASVQLTSLIRLLRTLSLLGNLEALLPPVTPGPMELLKRGKTRQRVRKAKSDQRESGWSWGDDK